jgi:hypothetical protein
MHRTILTLLFITALAATGLFLPQSHDRAHAASSSTPCGYGGSCYSYTYERDNAEFNDWEISASATSSWVGPSLLAWLHGTSGYTEHYGTAWVNASCSKSWPDTSCQTAYWGVCGDTAYPQGCGYSAYCSTPDACFYGTNWSTWNYSTFQWTAFSGTLVAYGNSTCWNTMRCSVKLP